MYPFSSEVGLSNEKACRETYSLQANTEGLPVVSSAATASAIGIIKKNFISADKYIIHIKESSAVTITVTITVTIMMMITVIMSTTASATTVVIFLYKNSVSANKNIIITISSKS
jgi:hypothetical protein